MAGVGDNLNISNKAIHHAVILLDLYASLQKQKFDRELAALASLMVSCKFVQMKYPSADSLNQVAYNAYNHDKIVAYEKIFLNVINW